MNKELEALEMVVVDLTPEAKEHNKEEIEFLQSALIEKQKLKQALKIINDKNVNISLLHCCNTVEDYNFEEHERYGDYAICYELTEEEFSFVKENLSLITKEME